MRIRQLVGTDNFAGVERYVATTATVLATRGHSVEIVGGHEGAMRRALADAPVDFVVAPRTSRALLANLRGPKVDVTHAHMTAADLVAVATKPVTRSPIVSTLHFAQPRGHDALTRRIFGLIPHLVTAEIAISHFVAAAVDGNPQVIPNGVPGPSSTPSIDAASREPTVLVAQRLESEKSTASALAAFAESGLAGDGWHLHLAGGGNERSELEALARRLGIGAATVFLGRVDDLGERMRRAAMLLATAPREPFGLSVVEAMAAGLPVIAADGGAHRETIGSACPESLFSPGDVPAAAALLRRLADDPAARERHAARGRERYEEAFTIEAHVDALEALYSRIVDGRQHPRPR